MSVRKDPKLTGRFRKNPAEENFLRELNDSLVELEKAREMTADDFPPSIFVCGIPRSGTTLLLQSAIREFELGYVTNLAAAFWKAPSCGIALSNQLLQSDTEVALTSEFGRTSGLSGPHEFGYFWSERLGYTDLGRKAGYTMSTAAKDALRSALISMSLTAGKPFIHKNALCNWHLAELAELLHNSLFVVIRRNPIDNALSLFEMRENMTGGRDEWISLKPQAYEWLKNQDHWTQVAGQVHFLTQEMNEQLAGVPDNRVIDFDLQDFCLKPASYLHDIGARLRSLGAVLTDSKNSGSSEMPEDLKLTYRRLRDESPDDASRITAAFRQLENEAQQ